MPYDDPDPQDPMVLVGVALPAGEEEEREMAYVFAEEFARLGFSEHQVLSLFREPYYAGAHRALARLGEPAVAAIVSEVAGVWGRMRIVDGAPGPDRTVPCDGSPDGECAHE